MPLIVRMTISRFNVRTLGAKLTLLGNDCWWTRVTPAAPCNPETEAVEQDLEDSCSWWCLVDRPANAGWLGLGCFRGSPTISGFIKVARFWPVAIYSRSSPKHQPCTIELSRAMAPPECGWWFLCDKSCCLGIAGFVLSSKWKSQQQTIY